MECPRPFWKSSWTQSHTVSRMGQSGETDLQGLGNAVWDLLLAVDEPVLEVCWCVAVPQVVSSAEHQGSLASVQRCATRLTLLPEV